MLGNIFILKNVALKIKTSVYSSYKINRFGPYCYVLICSMYLTRAPLFQNSHPT